MAALNKKFNGKTYSLKKEFHDKRYAEQYAKEMKERYYNYVRLVETYSGYAVYVRGRK